MHDLTDYNRWFIRQLSAFNTHLERINIFQNMQLFKFIHATRFVLNDVFHRDIKISLFRATRFKPF